MPAATKRRLCTTALVRADGYERRRPDETLLFQLVREHWPALRERAEEHGCLPRFVVRDFEAAV